jgi:hypothetical protein
MTVVLCCRDATALQTEAAEGALTGVEKLSFAAHLTICTLCQRFRSQLQATTQLLQALPPPQEEATPEDVDAVLRLLSGHQT